MTNKKNPRGKKDIANIRSKVPRAVMAKGKDLSIAGYKVLINLVPTWKRGHCYAFRNKWERSDNILVPIHGQQGRGRENCKEMKLSKPVQSGTPTKKKSTPVIVGSPKFPLPQAKPSSSGDKQLYYRQLCTNCGLGFATETQVFKCGVPKCSRLFVHPNCINMKWAGKSDQNAKEFCKKYIRCTYHLALEELIEETASKKTQKKSTKPKKKSPGSMTKKTSDLSFSAGPSVEKNHSRSNSVIRSSSHGSSVLSASPSVRKSSRLAAVDENLSGIDSDASNRLPSLPASPTVPASLARPSSPSLPTSSNLSAGKFDRIQPMSSSSSSSSSSDMSDPDFQKPRKNNVLSRKKEN